MQTSPELQNAVRDFLFLLNKAYPVRTSFQLVSNRYHLDKIQRIILYRGVFSIEEAQIRHNKKVHTIQDQILWIDALNVLYILSGYLLGHPVFLCLDGILRDAGEAFSKHLKEEMLERVINWCYEYMQESLPKEIHFVMDGPGIITETAEILLQGKFQEFPVPFQVHVCKKADTLLKKIQQGIIASSDSEILNHVPVHCIDLPFEILMRKFSPEFLSIQKMLE